LGLKGPGGNIAYIGEEMVKNGATTRYTVLVNPLLAG